ncbi:hypothetical protein [Alicyclobacillus fastidiosus]|uniref:hypothetical protein n=1 Tax=Alicyclobacillus fastidiosus TaxID=392011 RepID=UPI0023E933AB|nr:hypothetical protein [Alicyclobacillus fastidiosus]GMA66123.1 hypothetical protein GCM10025859_65650 [Alicyclobacillus fastidiosus]
MSFLHKIEFFGAVILGFWWLANAAVSYDRWSQRRLKCKNRDPRLGDCDSWIERRLYNAFLRLGYEPICQKKVGPYCIDLALMINGAKSSN